MGIPRKIPLDDRYGETSMFQLPHIVSIFCQQTDVGSKGWKNWDRGSWSNISMASVPPNSHWNGRGHARHSRYSIKRFNNKTGAYSRNRDESSSQRLGGSCQEVVEPKPWTSLSKLASLVPETSMRKLCEKDLSITRSLAKGGVYS